MLIYNASKEFVGIDERDLKILGFKDFVSLRNEVADFADLFVKTPGHVHNFKHVHWIDFIVFSESNEEFNAVIHANSKNFKAKLSIESLYLSQTPSLKSYIVYLNNLRELTKKESENISAEIAHRPIVRSATPVVNIEPTKVDEELYELPPQTQPTPATTLQIDPYETPLDVNFDDEDEEFEPVVAPKQEFKEPSRVAPEVAAVVDKPKEVIKQAPVSTPAAAKTDSFDNGYVYDPHLASHELGLPLDLIEEFIGDFILQAKEFKVAIYNALDASEFDQVKTLSHKLKGVAANLRIEDAFEALSVVNTSNEINAIKEHLDLFYNIIAKLAKEEINEEPLAPSVTPMIEEEDELIVAFKDDDFVAAPLDVDDAEVPQKIEMAELADDEFKSSEVDLSRVGSELDEIEDLALLELDSVSIDEEIAVELEEEAEEILHQHKEIVYSKESVAAEIGLDPHSFAELFDDYIQETLMILSHIKNAALIADFSTCSHEALKLQGMSDNMRVYGFESELGVIMSSEQSDEIVNAADRVVSMILTISK